MNRKSTFLGWSRALALGLGLWATAGALPASEANTTKTKWAERWITNVIEVTMPTNRFVDEYRTNWVARVRTNLVDVYTTNWTMRTVKRPVTVNAMWTNTVVAYRTNLIAWTLTNTVPVSVVRTNVVTRYHTNFSTINLTNWVTVLMFKTNWITQPVTNQVQVDLPVHQAAVPSTATAVPAEATPVKATATKTETLAPNGHWSGPLAILASRTTRPPAKGLVEVRMKVRYIGNGPATPKVQSWRIEREDGAVFIFGQEQEFVRQLPVGKYTVEARLRAEQQGQLLIVRGTLSVTASDALIQQRLLAKK